MSTVDERIAGLLKEAGLTVSVAESCSGGLLAKRLTDLPGSSAYFLCGAVTYANAAKEALLGVPAGLIETHGAVSSEVALAMAEGVRRVSGSDLALATTGIAGPDGGSPDKPVGTVYIAIAGAGFGAAILHRFRGDRAAVREATAEAALQLLLDSIPKR